MKLVHTNTETLQKTLYTNDSLQITNELNVSSNSVFEGNFVADKQVLTTIVMQSLHKLLRRPA